jgi:hypothetical protein
MKNRRFALFLVLFIAVTSILQQAFASDEETEYKPMPE